ncbi:YtpI family protein [Halobacillus yeomjeoni]|uniref:YtpI family protein n=1 Tax=Halobacillus yeomjeoni TaxID=311194 RepID=A0A931MUV4_9BACI|nr:YtpI family protein [Halobacillus yeomjeoni]MBH0230142.1 YtpI family protein [Halobacillus yeomjeoni]MCA0982489.1 YtpI family protein [Halobacillus yeomjeoni]
MFILPLFIVISLVLYIYYKVMIIRTKDPLTQDYLNSKSKVFLGSFIFFFGINQYVFYQTKLSLFIGLLFLVLGIFQAQSGWKASKHYRKEYQKLQSKTQS